MMTLIKHLLQQLWGETEAKIGVINAGDGGDAPLSSEKMDADLRFVANALGIWLEVLYKTSN